MKILLSRNSVCIACMTLPAIGFGTGLLAIAFPIAVLYTVLAVICAGWIGALRWVIQADVRDAQDAGGAAGALAALGTLFGLGAGLLVGGQGAFNLPVMLIAFSLGMVGALVYRKHRARAENQPAVVPAARAWWPPPTTRSAPPWPTSPPPAWTPTQTTASAPPPSAPQNSWTTPAPRRAGPSPPSASRVPRTRTSPSSAPTDILYI